MDVPRNLHASQLFVWSEPVCAGDGIFAEAAVAEIEVTGTVVEVEGERALIELEAQQEGRRIIRNARAELDLSFAEAVCEEG